MKFATFLKRSQLKKRELFASILIFLAVTFYITLFVISLFAPRPIKITVLDINTPDSVISAISEKTVKPVLYTRVPDLRELEIDERKKKFIDIILPSALLAQKIVEAKREEIKALKEKEELTPQDSLFLDSLITKFNAKDIDDLIFRLHPHPVSIIIAQAATESGWGTSRFTREANNIFGVWSFSRNDQRIEAGKTRDEKVIYLRKYDSLIGSIIDYLYTLAGSAAFSDFREKRTITNNPYRLIWFLQNYSEKRLEYVITLRNILEHNDLSRYDEMNFPLISEEDTTWQELLEKY